MHDPLVCQVNVSVDAELKESKASLELRAFDCH